MLWAADVCCSLSDIYERESKQSDLLVLVHVHVDVGLRKQALSAPLVAFIEPLLEGQHSQLQ